MLIDYLMEEEKKKLVKLYQELNIEKAVPLIFKETQGNDINEQPELKRRLVKAFPFWYLEALEKIIKEGNKLN